MSTYNNTLETRGPSVAQLVISYPAAVSVFAKYNIDYCCGGHLDLEDVCLKSGLDPIKIKEEIYQSTNVEGTDTLRPENWTSSFLVDFIIQNHHSYVRAAIPDIQLLLNKVCDVHGNDSLELLTIREAFGDLSEELIAHMEKEEFVLFPAIKRLDFKNNEEHPLTGAIQTPISVMEHEHALAGDLIKKIRSLSNNYTLPDFACPTYSMTYRKLQEFESDLMKHIHLENNILFARMKEKSKSVTQ